MGEWDDDEEPEELWLKGLIKAWTCQCREESYPTCSGCDHKQGCASVDCNYSEHFEILEREKARAVLFGRRQDCPCSSDDTEICEGCGHAWDCSAIQLRDCPDGVHLEEVASEAREPEKERTTPCHCDSSNKHGCPNCFHEEICEVRKACSERWFHFPGERAVEAPKPFDTLPERDVASGLPSRHRAYWTRVEDEQLITLFQAGLDFAGIAKEHGRTQRSIATRLTRLCFEENGVLIKSDPIEAEKAKEAWTDEDDDLLTTLHVNKLGLALLSAALKRSQRAVAIRLIHLRLVYPCNLDKVTYYSESHSSESSFRNARWTTPQYVEVREAFRQGSTLNDLAVMSGRSEGSCLMVLYARGEITVEDLQKAVESAQASISKE